MHLHQLFIFKNWTHGVQPLKSRFICQQWRKVKDQNKIDILDASLDRQPKIQSSSVEETLQRIMEQTNNDCRFLIFTFDKFPTPATFACWKIRFKTEVCTCSQFRTEAMQWIKEVELVDSVDELRSSSSTRDISMPNVEVLDARIASALNKIIHNSQFWKVESVWRNKKEDRFFAEDRLLTWSLSTSGSQEPTILSITMPTYSLSALRNDDIQEFDSKWDGILLSMTKIPLDDILEGMYKFRIREC